MLKLIAGIAIGAISCGLGAYFASLYFSTGASDSSPILVGLGVVFLAVGIFCFIKGIVSFRADKALAAQEAEELTSITQTTSGSSGGSEILKKNNQMLQEWNKTNEARDKLKVLEAAGVAEEGN